MIANRITGRKVVYTCISGNYDTLKDPTVVTPGWEYICFTDQKVISNVWTIRPLPKEIVEDKSLTQVKRQRIVKIQPWRFIGACDVCVWVDANLKIIGNIDDMIGMVGDSYLATITHPDRKDIYQESKAILRYRKDTM
jgi:rRNA processing protein Gar1